MMPERSGISIFMELRTDPALRHIPVAFMSGIPEGADFLAGKLRKLSQGLPVAPPEGFIEKPIRRERLIAFLENLLQ